MTSIDLSKLNVITGDILPDDIKIDYIIGIIESTYPIEISNKGFIRSITERNKNEHTEAYSQFVNYASKVKGPNGEYPNLLYGVRISSSIGSFNNGTFLYLTYCATTAIVSSKK